MISQSKMSKSKTKVVLQNMPSVDLLYKGYQRKLSQNQYVKNFPRFKLNLQGKNAILSSSKCSQNEALFSREILSLKQQNRRLADANCELKIKIKKESKMNEIYQKRIQNKFIEDISFQKLLEIKLLMEVEQFEEIFKRKQQDLLSITKLAKTKKQEINNINYGPFIALHEILLDDSSIQEFKSQKQSDLEKLSVILQAKGKRKFKLKSQHKKAMEELKTLISEIQKQKGIMSYIPKNVQENESGVLSTQYKNKNIEQIQAEIVMIAKDSSDYEIKIQKQMDKMISEKILILNEIERLSANKLKKENRKGTQLKLFW